MNQHFANAIHADEFRILPNDSMPKPWLVYSEGDFDTLETENLLKGQMILLYLPSIQLSFSMTIPGIVQAFDRNFKFRDKFIDMATKTLEKVKKKTKHDVSFIGVHVRRGDFEKYEIAKKLKV